MTSLGFVCRALLALVLLSAAAGKAHRPDAIRRTMRSIGIPRAFVQTAAWLLIAWETTLGILFALGAAPVATTLGALLLMTLFASVSIHVARQQRLIPCNCFGTSETPLGSQTLTQVVLLMLPVGGYYLAFRSPHSIWWPTTSDTVVSSLSLVIAAILFSRWLFALSSLALLSSSVDKRREPFSRFRISTRKQRTRPTEGE